MGPDDSAQIAAFRAFLDFDGKGAHFGDLGLSVTGEKASDNSVYAALDSKDPNRLTLVAINKTASPLRLKIRVDGFAGKVARAFAAAYDSPFNPKTVPATASASGVEFEVPPLGVVTVEVRK